MLSSPYSSDGSSALLAIGFSSPSLPSSPTFDESPKAMRSSELIQVSDNSSPIMAVGFSDSDASFVCLSPTEQRHDGKNFVSLFTGV